MDREKVIKGLECHAKGARGCLFDCPYGNENGCQLLLCSDALALLNEQEHKDKMFHALEDDWKRLKELLKEQDAEIEKLKRFVNGFSRDAMPVVRCKNCAFHTDSENCPVFGMDRYDDWFCADGKRQEGR